MKRRFNLKQNKKQKNDMNSEEKKAEEMKNVAEEAAENTKEQPAPEDEQLVEGEAQNEAEEPEKELTPEEKLQAAVDKAKITNEDIKSVQETEE